MFSGKFIRNTLVGGLFAGFAWASLVLAFINMSESESTAWRLDSPIPWIVAIMFAIPAVILWFKD